MPGSTSEISGAGIPGLTLRAWALIRGADGLLLKSSGVSASTRAGVGSYTATFSPLLPSVAVVIQAEFLTTATSRPVITKTALTTTTLSFNTNVAGAAADVENIFIAVYG